MRSSMCVRMSNERSFLKSQWFSFSTENTIRTQLGRKRRKRRTFGHTPQIFTSFDNTTIGCLDVLSRADDGEGNCVRKDTRVAGASLVIIIDRGLVDADALCGDDFTDLQTGGKDLRIGSSSIF